MNGEVQGLSTIGRPRRQTKPELAAAFLCLACAAAVLCLFRPGLVAPLAAAALSLGAVWLAFYHLRSYLYAVVAFLFLLGFVKNAFYQHLYVYFLQDALLALLYVVWFIKYPLKLGFRGRYDKATAASIIVFVAYAFILTVVPFTAEPWLLRLGGARWWLEFIPLFFVGADLLDTARRFDRLAVVFLIMATVTSIYGVIQYLIGFQHLYNISERFRDNAAWGVWTGISSAENLRTRVFSTFDLATTFANTLRVACLVAVAYFAHSGRRVFSVFPFIALVACFAALLLTGTRAAYVPLAISLVTFIALGPGRKRVVFSIAALVVGFAVVMAVSSWVYLYRVMLIVTDYHYTFARISWDWEKAIALVRDLPFGLGISTSAKTSQLMEDAIVASGGSPSYRFIEHGFGQALVSLGWPGLVLFSAMFATVLARTGRSVFKTRRSDWRVTLAFTVCFAELFPLLTHATLNFGLSPVMFWLMSGAALSFQRSRDKAGAEAGRDAPAWPVNEKGS